MSRYLSRGFSLLTLGAELVDDAEDGLVGQDVLLLPLHHPGVSDCPEVPHQVGQHHLLLVPQVVLQTGEIPGLESPFEEVGDGEDGGEGPTPAHSTTTVNN